MHAWTKSACVVLAWSILPLILIAAGMKGSVHPAQANNRTATSTEISLTSTLNVAAAPTTATNPPASYVVQPGDSLSGIAAQFAVRGGWPALYAANRSAIGPDPDVIRPGTVLMVPGLRVPLRYTVAAGATLSGIADALSVPGGWPALYAANRPAIGPDPDVIRPGTVLTIPQQAASPAPGPAHRPHPAPRPSPPAGTRHHPQPVIKAPAARGMPHWLTILLLAVGLLMLLAFLTEPVLAVRCRRRQAATRPSAPGAGAAATARPGAGKANIVLADHDQLVVTRSQPDGTIYVLRPPGADPQAILRTARLVVPDDLCRELAAQLGMPASWPIVLADHDQLIVTRSQPDDMVYVLRPPGEDPREILRVARLVLPEEPYGELAAQLGVPAGLPME